jgi:hypothetical protein
MFVALLINLLANSKNVFQSIFVIIVSISQKKKKDIEPSLLVWSFVFSLKFRIKSNKLTLSLFYVTQNLLSVRTMFLES